MIVGRRRLDRVKLVLATGNPHKVEELRRILGPQLEGFELTAYDGPMPVEDGSTFAENALIKARAAAEHTGLPALADDSGICVEALGGAPGIHSARYAGTRNDDDNVALLLHNLEGVIDRRAHFACAAALVVPGPRARETTKLGIWTGEVARERAGEGGFGYDPVFRPEGLEVTSAELAAEEKNAISHRARAFQAIAPQVRELLR